MQYILTQEEYKALQNKDADVQLDLKNEIADLCQEVASLRHVSNNFNGVKTNTPYGCIRNVHLSNEWPRAWYCDDCPVRTICTFTGKEYSK